MASKSAGHIVFQHVKVSEQFIIFILGLLNYKKGNFTITWRVNSTFDNILVFNYLA